MTLTFTQGHRVTRNLKLVKSVCCRVGQAFAVVNHVREMTSEKTCKHSEYGPFDHLPFLLGFGGGGGIGTGLGEVRQYYCWLLNTPTTCLCTSGVEEGDRPL